jgi:hypothetical protein
VRECVSGDDGGRLQREIRSRRAAEVLPLSERNERGRGRGEGRPRAQCDPLRRASYHFPSFTVHLEFYYRPHAEGAEDAEDAE